MHILKVITFLGFGYLFGKITCNSHFKKSGFWITIIAFVIINAIHSLVDGVGLAGRSINETFGLLVGHEMLRQPILYVLFFGIIAPFEIPLVKRMIISVLAVTGVWYGSLLIGSQIGTHLLSIQSLEPWTHYFTLIFVGDMVHHIIDWFQMYRKKLSNQ